MKRTHTIAALFLFLLPALHPLLRPVVGVPSHLLWWAHVLPVALLTYRFGRRGGVPAGVASLVLVIAGERLFGAGYGTAATWETALSLAVALTFTNALVAGFAEYARRVASRLQHNATHDALTGLPNRRLLVEHLEERMARRDRRAEEDFAVLYLDLDHFKRINDSLGHSFGDRLLRRVAARLEGLVRGADVVARWGGDEFVVLLDHLEGPENAVRVAGRIVEALERPMSAGDNEVVMSGCLGIAVSSEHYGEPEELLRNADTAMYRAKERGSGKVQLFDPSMHRSAVERLNLESQLRRALERDELRLYYQPVFAVEGGAIRSLEVLLRWEHPDRGLLLPGEFLEIAEVTGMITPIGFRVLERACEELELWSAETGPGRSPPRVNLNISAEQLSQSDFVDRVVDICGESCLAARRIDFEITETVLMENAAHILDGLEALRELGIGLSVDDFGTGYSSLAYLHRFPVDTLKIDRSFVSGEASESTESGVIEAIVALAAQLGLETVAEGVETEDQLRRMRSLRVDRVQGYHLARPMPAGEVGALLRRLRNRPGDRERGRPSRTPPRP